MLSLSPSCRYFIYHPQADMRKGFDSLSGLVRDGLAKNPLSGDVFIFFNRRRTQVELLDVNKSNQIIADGGHNASAMVRIFAQKTVIAKKYPIFTRYLTIM